MKLNLIVFELAYPNSEDPGLKDCVTISDFIEDASVETINMFFKECFFEKLSFRDLHFCNIDNQYTIMFNNF